MEDDLERIMNATSQEGLMQAFKAFGKSVAELSQLAAKRQAVSFKLTFRAFKDSALNITITRMH